MDTDRAKVKDLPQFLEDRGFRVLGIRRT